MRKGVRMSRRYVLNLIEDSNSQLFKGELIGYWDGKAYRGDDVIFPGVLHNKFDPKVKVYTSEKGAQNAADKLKEKFTFIIGAEIESLSE